jgi:transposase
VAKHTAEILIKDGTRDEPRLTNIARQTFTDLLNELYDLQKRIDSYEKKIEAMSRAHPVCQKLMTIPGIGPITASAVMSAVGDATTFKNGRQFAAWLGLVPRQHSTGGKPRLLGISKRGNKYIRMLLILGAKSVMMRTGQYSDRRSMWIKQLEARRGKNRTAVALTNKNARVVWVLMTKKNPVEYEKYECPLAA